LTSSKVFSKSSLKIACPFFFLDLLKQWIISCKTMALSEVPIPGRKLLWQGPIIVSRIGLSRWDKTLVITL